MGFCDGYYKESQAGLLILLRAGVSRFECERDMRMLYVWVKGN